jgi:hypothetical protein
LIHKTEKDYSSNINGRNLQTKTNLKKIVEDYHHSSILQKSHTKLDACPQSAKVVKVETFQKAQVSDHFFQPKNDL